MSVYEQGPPPMQGSSAGMPQRRVPVRPGGGAAHRPEGSETKPAFKTTELIAYMAAVFGVLLAAAVVGDDGDGHDGFGSDRAGCTSRC